MWRCFVVNVGELSAACMKLQNTSIRQASISENPKLSVITRRHSTRNSMSPHYRILCRDWPPPSPLLLVALLLLSALLRLLLLLLLLLLLPHRPLQFHHSAPASPPRTLLLLLCQPPLKSALPSSHRYQFHLQYTPQAPHLVPISTFQTLKMRSILTLTKMNQSPSHTHQHHRNL